MRKFVIALDDEISQCYVQANFNNELNDKSRLRLNIYRKRVRSLAFPQDFVSGDDGHKAALHLCHLLRREDLFPSLRRLYVRMGHGENISALLPFLLTHSLRTIDLRGFPMLPYDLFPLVANLCPGTATLKIEVSRDPRAKYRRITGCIPLEALSSLQQLRSLVITDCFRGQSRWFIKNSSIRKLLASLPCLSELSLEANYVEDDMTSPQSQAWQPMAPLEVFKLTHRSSPETGLPLLRLLPFLTTLWVTIPSTCTRQEAASFLSTVAAHPQLSNFWVGAERSDDGSLLVLDVEDVLPLFTSLTLLMIAVEGFNLTHLDNINAEPSLPSNMVVDILAATLRQYHGPLEHLRLPSDISPMPTFDSLIQFAEHTPWLRHLSIPVCVPPGWQTQAESWDIKPFANSLQHLHIENRGTPFRTQDRPLLAEYIDRWFPNLECVKCEDENDDNLPHIDDFCYELSKARSSSLTG
jgi:hypothetical protein